MKPLAILAAGIVVLAAGIVVGLGLSLLPDLTADMRRRNKRERLLAEGCERCGATPNARVTCELFQCADVENGNAERMFCASCRDRNQILRELYRNWRRA